jgi:hypothetical protein
VSIFRLLINDLCLYPWNRRNDTIVEQRLGNSGRYKGEPDFQTRNIFEPYNKSIPHRGCSLFDGAVSDDRLRKSEVFCAAALMAARLGDAEKTGDRIVPVGIYPGDRLDTNYHERCSFTLSPDTRLV